MPQAGAGGKPKNARPDLAPGSWQDAAMRGMVDGRWYRDLEAAGLATGFTDRGFTDGIPSERFPAEAGRYHLYVSYACPYAHLTILARSMLGLEAAVPMSVCDPSLGGPEGWHFARADEVDASGARADGVTVDRVHGVHALHGLYSKADPRYTGRITVPVLWDTVEQTIVSNYSTGILRALELGLAAHVTRPQWLFPAERRDAIRAASQRVMEELVYTAYDAGYARTQAAHEAGVRATYAALARFDAELAAGGPFLLGDTPTEADMRLFVSLIRFDSAYAGAFYLNLRRVADHPALRRFLDAFMALPGVAETVRFDHYRVHYFDDDVFVLRQRQADGRFIVPLGPRSHLEPEGLDD
jgi:putative glutathione S-transferase